MLIIPAIDIIENKVVRLVKGSFKERKEYSSNPVAMAEFWQKQGAQYLHIVDLDGAVIGKPINFETIEAMVKAVSIPVEVGGGIRRIEDIKRYLDIGVDKIVLGTVVIQDLSFLDNEVIKSNPKKISISLDGGEIKSKSSLATGTAGWTQEVSMPIVPVIDKMIAQGIRYLNYTDRRRDGTLQGVDKEQMALFFEIIKAKDIDVIYAGGISTLDDLKQTVAIGKDCLKGIIIGKALYEERFTLKEALEAVK